jgi:hypothetical protein
LAWHVCCAPHPCVPRPTPHAPRRTPHAARRTPHAARRAPPQKMLRRCSEDVNVLPHATALVLRDALGDPDDVPDLLLLELYEGVVHAVVELLLEGEPVEVDLGEG